MYSKEKRLEIIHWTVEHSNESLRDIAKRFGVSYGYIKMAVRGAGMARGNHGPNLKARIAQRRKKVAGLSKKLAEAEQGLAVLEAEVGKVS